MATSNLIQIMKEKAEAVQAIVVKIKTMKEAFQYTVDLTRQQGGTSMVAMGLGTQDVNLLGKACKTADLIFLKSPLRLHANEIVAAIAKENNVKKIIKSKSMTAEETFLNDHLENKGYFVTETDLGELIIQLRKEGPSHMVMPAFGFGLPGLCSAAWRRDG